MKKGLRQAMAILLALTLMLGSFTTAFAAEEAESPDFTQEIAQLLEGLNDEVVDILNNLTEELSDNFIPWFLEYMLQFYDIYEIVELLNEGVEFWSPEELEEDLRLLYVELRFTTRSVDFLFGEYATVEDMAIVLAAIMEEYYHLRNFDMRVLLEDAGMTEEEFVNFFWVFLTETDEINWYMQRHGDAWLFYAVRSVVNDVEWDYRFTGRDAAAMYLQLIRLLANMFELMGVDYAEEFFDLRVFWGISDFLRNDEMVLVEALISDHFTATMIRLVEEYGASIVVEMMDIDLLADLELFIEYDTKTQGLIYVDELMGGIIFENYEEMHAALTIWQDDGFQWSVEPAYRHLFSWMELWESESPFLMTELLNLAWDYVQRTESTSIPAEDQEHRFFFNVDISMLYSIFIDEARENLNLFFDNPWDESVFMLYVFYEGDTWQEIYAGAVEVAPNSQFTVQINLNDFEVQNFILLDVFIVNPARTPINGEFAFRWTAYPLGYERNNENITVAEDAIAHIVAAGESISSIAQLHGVTVSALVEANHLYPGTMLFIGQELIIPV